jgi:DNA polymerase III subunit delta'
MPITSILGHREIATRLLAELHSRPSHAYLFSGPRGVGKALVATSLVHAMMCERSPGENFCCATGRCPIRLAPQTERTRARRGDADTPRCECCSACVQIASGVHPDFTYISLPPGRSEVSIDQVREMIVRLGTRPSRAPVQMAIVDDAETLGPPAQNALLKTLEEPPGHAIIFMITSSERALLDTIRSRMRTVRFPGLQPADLETILASHGVTDSARAGALALLARGSAANAIAHAGGDEPPMAELLDQLGTAESIDFARANSIAQQFFANRDAAADNFELLARLLEEILCYKLLRTGLEAVPAESRSKMITLADRFAVDAVVKCIDAAVRGKDAIEQNANPRLQGENWWSIAGRAMRGE